MAKVFVEFDIVDQTLRTHIPTPKIRAGTKDTYYAKLFFDAAWEDLSNIRAVFFRDNLCKPIKLTEENGVLICRIFPEVIAEPGQFAVGLFAGSKQITNLEFVPVFPGFKNEIFNNEDVMDWFDEVDKLIEDILQKTQWKSNMTDSIDEESTTEQYPNAPAVVAYTQAQDLALKTVIVTLLSALEERLTQNINGKSPIGHNHNEIYFTETEIINLLKGYVTTVNGFSGDVTISTDSIGAEKAGTAQQLLTAHNAEQAAHNDIRLLIQGLTDRLNAVLDSDDTTLDQMSEVVAYIKNNADLIAGITTSKINYSDIVNDLVTNVTNKPLSAAQGVALKKLIDAIIVPTKLSELTNDTEFQTAAQVEAKLSLKAPSDHTHDERYFTQEAVAEFYNSLTRIPITVTETVSGTSTVITCDHTLGQIQAYTGTPYVCYMLDVGADSGASLVCFAELYSKSDSHMVFASAPDSTGHAHIFTVNSAGVTHTVFTAKPYFSAVPVIAKGYDDEIPNVFAVMNYVNMQTDGLQLRQACFVKPASPAEGDIYYNTDDKTVQTYTGGAWTVATAADENTVYFVFEG